MVVSEINSVEFDSSDTQMFPDMFFPAACVGSDQTQHLQVVNDTGLPVEYEWIWVDMRCTDLHAQGQRQIYDRERIETARHSLIVFRMFSYLLRTIFFLIRFMDLLYTHLLFVRWGSRLSFDSLRNGFSRSGKVMQVSIL